MCSVLFLDIVEYSKKTVAEQIALKERFNGYLSAALHSVPAADRVILDAGDGAAVSFLGDVEDALRTALRLRESLFNEAPDVEPRMQLRIGVNLGPVRLVMDINGQPNVVGDGINVAQRVMGFAEPGQILISRSYYEAVERLSGQYEAILSYQGSRTDKHVREHEIYAVVRPGETTLKRLSETTITRARATLRAGMRGRTLYVGAAVAAAVLIGVLAFKPDRHAQNAAAPEEPAMPTENAAPPVASSASVTPPVSAAATGTGAAKQPGDAGVKQAQQNKTKPKPKPAAPAVADKRGSTDASITIICKNDEGRVFVDYFQKGEVSYGKLTLTLRPGRYTVLVKHSSGLLHKQKVSLAPGDTMSINPKFCN